MKKFKEWLSDYLRYIMLFLAAVLVFFLTLIGVRAYRNHHQPDLRGVVEVYPETESLSETGLTPEETEISPVSPVETDETESGIEKESGTEAETGTKDEPKSETRQNPGTEKNSEAEDSSEQESERATGGASAAGRNGSGSGAEGERTAGNGADTGDRVSANSSENNHTAGNNAGTGNSSVTGNESGLLPEQGSGITIVRQSETQAPRNPQPIPNPQPITETETETETEPQPVYMTLTGSCYLRSGPGYEYGIIGEYTYGTTVRVLDDSTGWYKVEVDGMTGYMGGRFFH